MTQEILDEIKSCSQKAADSIKLCLEKADLEAYKNFLNQMYHYTLKSGEKALTAAKNAPTEELREFFEHMYREERNHYMLAVQDLRGFDMTPTAETPKEVEDFNKFWDSLEEGHFNGYLGALYVFENIADKVGKEVMDLLKRLNLNEKQKRWLSIHVEADEEHGSLATNFLKKYLPLNPKSALEGAREAANRWIAVNEPPFAHCLKN